MIHKKQAYNQIVDTIKWNTVRGNTPDTLDWNLEINMLQEELDELKLAIKQGDEVGAFDAMLDLKFVLYGTMGKANLSPEQIVDGYEAVMKANNSKSETKNAAGKITKPTDFIGPEPELQKILDKRIM